MNNSYQYPGRELELFEEARNWKKYFSRELKDFIRGDVLEVGAGIGETTPYLQNTKVNSWTCLEPDESLYAVLSKKIPAMELPYSCSAVRGTLDGLQDSQLFDTIIYIDVLEHIENDRGEIKKAMGHLKQGGHLLVLSPAFQFLFNRFDGVVGHYRRYNKTSLRAAVPANGLAEKKLVYLESLGVSLLLLNKFIFRKTYPTRTVVRLWDKMIPLSRLADKIFQHSFGKSLIGVWQKQ